MWSSGELAFSRSSSYRDHTEDEEEALQWAAIERLPTITRARRGLLRRIELEAAGCRVDGSAGAGAAVEVDVARLTRGDRTALIDRLLGDSGDAHNFFQRIRHRFDASVSFLSIYLPCNIYYTKQV
jgi:hypothetical protein